MARKYNPEDVDEKSAIVLGKRAAKSSRKYHEAAPEPYSLIEQFANPYIQRSKRERDRIEAGHASDAAGMLRKDYSQGGDKYGSPEGKSARDTARRQIRSGYRNLEDKQSRKVK